MGRLVTESGAMAVAEATRTTRQEGPELVTLLNTFADDFWSRVDRKEGDCCWIWKPVTMSYSKVSASFKNLQPRRVAWMLTRGSAPASRYLRAGCGEARCVRPDHMLAGTTDAKPARSRRSAPGSRHCAGQCLEMSPEACEEAAVQIREARRRNEMLVNLGILPDAPGPESVNAHRQLSDLGETVVPSGDGTRRLSRTEEAVLAASRELKPGGGEITDKRLAAHSGLSRDAVRLARRCLEQDGLYELWRHRKRETPHAGLVRSAKRISRPTRLAGADGTRRARLRATIELVAPAEAGELAAMVALLALDPGARGRVLAWAADHLDTSVIQPAGAAG